MTQATNPLLDFTALPRFDQISPASVEPAIRTLLQDAEAALHDVTRPEFPASWHALSTRLDVACERLTRGWSVVGHLNSVADTPELRAAYNAMLPAVTDFFTRLGADERLYAKFKAIDATTLNDEQRQALRLNLRDFVLGGAELQGAARTRFAAIQERLAALSQKFSENALDATDGYHYDASQSEVAGLPPDVLHAARTAAQTAGVDAYRLTLKIPCYLPVLQFAHDRGLRERLYRAYVTRASDQGARPEWDNSALMRELLELRQEVATLLGFAHYGALSLAPKMADSAEQVLQFLRDLARRARPYALRDLADMRALARTDFGLTDPQSWDWAYLAERLKEQRYAYSEQDVKPYLTAPRVLQGLFGLAERLFDLRIVADQAPTWDPDVRFFRLERDGALLGQFYLDPTARNGKRGGAWMDDARSRWLRPDNGDLQTPVAYLVCNFAGGVDGKPALLTHDDVITLFHEFGHGLHHLLTQVGERDIAGISGVEWDAVELPSQFMENFCWDWSVLQPMTAHVDTGQSMPRALFDKMLAARNFQSGLQTLRQVEFALFDMLLHTQADAASRVQQVLDAVRAEVAVLQPPAWNRAAHTFSHIFAGGYAAGYYSYKWAEVLSADAYAAFEESPEPDGLPSRATGQRFRQAILEAGGSRPALESFVAFRGRPPGLDALLRHQGMDQPLVAEPA